MHGSRTGPDLGSRHFVGSACFAPPSGVVYGPLASPSLARALGVNVSPAHCRVCSFDCVYCEFDPGQRSGPGLHWPTAGEVQSQIANALPRRVSEGPVDALVVAGRGEPTLHPRFCAVVASVLAEARRARPPLRTAILTNGTGAVRGDVRRALDLFDERILRLDAAPERVNRPGSRYLPGAVLCGLALLRDVSVHACFVEGGASNVDAASVSHWIELLAELEPRRVELYTLPGRLAERGAEPTSRARLEAIARAVCERMATTVHVLCDERLP